MTFEGSGSILDCETFFLGYVVSCLLCYTVAYNFTDCIGNTDFLHPNSV